MADTTVLDAVAFSVKVQVLSSADGNVAKQADALDSKSGVLYGRKGSIPFIPKYVRYR